MSLWDVLKQTAAGALQAGSAAVATSLRGEGSKAAPAPSAGTQVPQFANMPTQPQGTGGGGGLFNVSVGPSLWLIAGVVILLLFLRKRR